MHTHSRAQTSQGLTPDDSSEMTFHLLFAQDSHPSNLPLPKQHRHENMFILFYVQKWNVTLHNSSFFPPQNPSSSGGTKPKVETCHIVCYAPLTAKALNNTSSFQIFLTTIDTPANILPRWNHIQLLWYLQARVSGKEIKSHVHLKFLVDSARHLSQMAGSKAGRLLAGSDISQV